MKLLFVQDSLGTGGAERSNAESWYDLRERKNLKIKIVVLEHRKEGIEKQILQDGFDVIFLKNGNFLSQVAQIKKIIGEFLPDIVHSVLFRSAIRVRTARFTQKFYHIESLVNCSYSPIRYQDPKINKTGLTIFKYINQLTQAKGTDKFIAITEEVKKHAIEHLKVAPIKVEVVPRGRAENPFLNEKDEARKKIISELGISESTVLFIHVGRQEYQKGHMDLLKAIERIGEELVNKNFHFLFCGREGNATYEIKEFLKDKSFSSHLHWLGHRHDIPELLSGSNIFVFPSLFEGLGGALIEAQAAALPVICSDIPVFEEVVTNNNNALMFRVTDPHDLALRLIQLGSDKELQSKMGKESLKNFRNKFLIKNIHERVFNLYKTLVQ